MLGLVGSGTETNLKGDPSYIGVATESCSTDNKPTYLWLQHTALSYGYSTF